MSENVLWCESFKIYLDLVYGPEYGLPWEMFYVYFKRMCILLLLGWVFYKCQVEQVGWLCFPHLLHLSWFSLYLLYQFLRKCYLKPATIIMDSLILGVLSGFASSMRKYFWLLGPLMNHPLYEMFLFAFIHIFCLQFRLILI